jgi:hypothetical protein
MRIFDTVWLVSKAKIILYAMIVMLLLALYFYWDGPKESKLTTLLGGVSTGLILVIIQFMFSWNDYKERDKFRLLGLKNVLEHKKDRTYYGKLIHDARERIDLMGKTSSHFIEDFANDGGAHKEAKFLLEALGRGVKVRFLLPETAKSEKNSDTISEVETLARKHNNFLYRFFDYTECHSIFAADNDVIIGPFFPGIKSMDTPALHVRHDAVLSKRYLEYFEETWENCAPID